MASSSPTPNGREPPSSSPTPNGMEPSSSSSPMPSGKEPPSPPLLALPHPDSQDALTISQPPLCTPIDQVITPADHHPTAPPLSALRTTAKRRRSNIRSIEKRRRAPLRPDVLSYSSAELSRDPVRPLPMSCNTASLPPTKSRQRPTNPLESLMDEDSIQAPSQTFSQRDIPQFSQDTLAVLPKFLKEHHLTKYGIPSSAVRQPSSPNMNDDPSREVPSRDRSASEDALARASLVSALTSAPPLLNPFISRREVQTPAHFTFRQRANASESFQNMDALLDPMDDTNSLGMSFNTTPVESLMQPMFATPVESSLPIPITPTTASNVMPLCRPDRRTIAQQKSTLKLIIVSSNQSRPRSHDFEYHDLAGRGAFSEVHRATNRMDGCVYAIKKNLTALKNDEARLDALQEVFALAALQGHPNILRYNDVWFEDKGLHIYVQTEYLSQGNIQSLYVDKRSAISHMDLIGLVEDMSSALEFMHSRGIAHVDVKPDNIFRASRHLDRPSFILGDFGLACHRYGQGARNTEGDSRYLCPEALNTVGGRPFRNADICMSDGENEDQVDDEGRPLVQRRKSSPVDEQPRRDLFAADVFSLGMTVYEMAMGEPLEKSGVHWKRLREQPDEAALEVLAKSDSTFLANVVRRCLDLDPNLRATASDIKRMCTQREVSVADNLAAKLSELQSKYAESEERVLRFQTVMATFLQKGEEGRAKYRNRRAKKAPSRRAVLNCRD